MWIPKTMMRTWGKLRYTIVTFVEVKLCNVTRLQQSSLTSMNISTFIPIARQFVKLGSIMGIAVANGRNLEPANLNKEVFIRFNSPPLHIRNSSFPWQQLTGGRPWRRSTQSWSSTGEARRRVGWKWTISVIAWNLSDKERRRNTISLLSCLIKL